MTASNIYNFPKVKVGETEDDVETSAAAARRPRHLELEEPSRYEGERAAAIAVNLNLTASKEKTDSTIMDGPRVGAPDTEAESLHYMVVTFTHDNIEYVSAAPRQWLRKEGNMVFCMWPKSKLIERKAIKLCMEPEEDWTMYEVQVVGYFATLTEALAREKSKQNSTSSESEVRDKGKRKIIKKKYRDDSISPPPTFNEKESNIVTPVPMSNVADASRGTASENLESNIVTPVPMSNVADASRGTASENLESNIVTPVPMSNVADASRGTASENLESQTFPSASEIITAEFVLSDDLPSSLDSCQSVCKSENVVTELKEIKSFVTYIMRKVEEIELSLTKMNVPSQPKPTLLPKLPLTQIHQINSLENMLSDDNIRTELFDMLRHTGGSKERDCVNRCLEKVFSDYLGQYCSWTGKKNNFKLASLTLMIVIKRAVRETFPNMTDDSFERHVMNFFQHASTRLKRHN